MARSGKGRPVHGWLVLDKPAGITSAKAVGRVRHAFVAQKAGHAGTLDPLATGVLPIALGEATKTIPYVVSATKAYRFTLAWGEARDTDDADGAVTGVSAVRPDKAAIEAALPSFVGALEQVPPVYSAVKVGGARAYDLARAEGTVALPPRQVRVDRFELVAVEGPDRAVFEVVCGKGAYMRALARDLALALGTLGHIAALRRTAVGPFREEHAIPLESVVALRHSPAALEHLLPVETALDDIPALALTKTEALRLRRGQPVSMLARSNLSRIGQLRNGDLLCAMGEDKPVAVARFEAGEVRPVRVLNL
jgi:tRNA pseudouridine55 synthase